MLPSEWLWQPPADDYGIDGIVAIGNDKAVTPFEFGVQVKSCRRWETKDKHLFVRGVSTDAVRYWALRLVPTLLVAYETASGKGFYAWIPDLVSIESFANENATVTLKVPLAQRIDDDCWIDIKTRVLAYHQLIAAAIREGHVTGAILVCINSLGKCLRLLCTPSPGTESPDEDVMHWSLAQAIANRDVVTSIRRLACKVENSMDLGKQLLAAADAYGALCAKIFHPFELLLESTDQHVAIWFNQEAAADLYPQLLSQIANMITTLSGTTAHSHAA